MANLKIKRLERDEGLRELLYHIKGIVEASDNVVDLMKTLDGAYKRDATTFADTTALLEVQAMHHLGYHVKSLRAPLRRLQREAYAEIDAGNKVSSKRAGKQKADEHLQKPTRSRRTTSTKR